MDVTVALSLMELIARESNLHIDVLESVAHWSYYDTIRISRWSSVDVYICEMEQTLLL